MMNCVLVVKNCVTRTTRGISKQQKQPLWLSIVRYYLDGIIIGISFPFSRSCLSLLGFPFGGSLLLPACCTTILSASPPPSTPTTAALGNDSNNGFDVLIQSRDIPGGLSNNFPIIFFLLVLYPTRQRFVLQVEGCLAAYHFV